ncbi:MAG: sporulation initiation factor Spo0A C-terminal domain-containing protein [Candidatus Pelethousia sp.]|nr:sporulation initiation factor Spo0A C-terminal domain-containing protein [Candidatus Pelethousia sp.]
MYDRIFPADVLHEIGMQPKYKGYAYLLFMLQQTERRPEMMYNLSHGLYMMTMRHFMITRNNMERNIRFAIRRTWEDGNQAAIRRIFGAYDMQDVPSVAEFLTILTECMLCKRTRARRA